MTTGEVSQLLTHSRNLSRVFIMNYLLVSSFAGRRSKVRSLYPLAIAALAGLLLTACSSGGSNDGDGAPAPTGSVEVTVVDEFGAPVIGASVSIDSGGTGQSSTTDSNGVATVTSVPRGTASVSITQTDFFDFSDSVSVVEDSVTPIFVTLVRETEPAAGLFSVRLTENVGVTDGQTVTFSVEVVVVDNDPNAVTSIETLTAADFSLNPCSDNNPDKVECLLGNAMQPDVGYSVVTTTPQAFELRPGAAAETYAANLMIDQSGSMETSDPSDARLFATKVFLQNLGPSDFGAVSAFAAWETALIETVPVTRITDFIQSGAAEDFFADIDVLAELEGGGTPLLNSIDEELDYVAANAPASVDRSAIVLFTDGLDSGCVEIACISPITAKAVNLDVDVFTIGLGPLINASVLARMAQDTGGFFLFAQYASQLFPIYRSLGNLLSGTLSTYRMEWTIQADAANTYKIGQTILGTLVITTPKNQIDLPLRVFITD
jgi:hypothetical protein